MRSQLLHLVHRRGPRRLPVQTISIRDAVVTSQGQSYNERCCGYPSWILFEFWLYAHVFVSEEGVSGRRNIEGYGPRDGLPEQGRDARSTDLYNRSRIKVDLVRESVTNGYMRAKVGKQLRRVIRVLRLDRLEWRGEDNT